MVTVASDATIPAHYSSKTLRIVAACFFLSGATGLIYEVLWARMLGLVFGATTLAVSTVLAAFMGGLALGSALAGKFGEKLRRPVLAYGLLELCVAIYAIAVPLLFRVVDNLYAFIWQHLHPSFFAFSVWRFVLSCALLLIPTTLMGATLPVLSAALMRSVHGAASVTRLYTRNLAGAIAGTLIAGFLLLPTLGVRTTIFIAAAVNVVIGVSCLLLDKKNVQAGEFNGLTADRSAYDGPTEALSTTTSFWLTCAFISGFVTISTQVAWTRMLTMIIGSSTYAFSIVVALFLLGLAGGAALVARTRANPRQTVLVVELATAVSLLLSLAVANRIPALLISFGLTLHIQSWSGLLGLQIASVTLLLLLPAFLMGMVMPLVLRWAERRSGERTVRLVGRSYAVNTLGAIAGAFLSGFVLIPKTSTRFTLLFAAALCVVVAGIAYESKRFADRDMGRAFAVGLSVVMIAFLFLAAPKMNLADLSIGAYDSLVRVIAKSRGGVEEGTVQRQGPEVHELLMYEEGPTSTVSVRKDWDITSMAINGRTNASDREDMPTQVMLGQMPLLIAPHLNNALVVGYATGVTAGSILQSPITSVECVELEPATVNGSRFFEHVNNHPLSDPRLRLIIDDARTYLRVTPNHYDIIVSEPSHPWVPGVANLFTREFFEMGRERLNDDGIFVQWLQIYQMSTESLRSVLATFNRAFPHVLVFRVEGAWKGKDLLLIGSKSALTLDHIGERMTNPQIANELARVNIKTENDARAWFVCDENRLTPAIEGAVINTDDNMHIETTVPREAFRPLLETNSAWLDKLALK